MTQFWKLNHEDGLYCTKVLTLKNTSISRGYELQSEYHGIKKINISLLEL